MGVKNLWQLLLPIGKRISIESLSHQTLAIDASIWLTQISKACRDPETGRLLPNRPHVRIFLLRLMRLLYHSIKPVVVFDGVMPEVKRRELRRRRDRREKLWRDDEEQGDILSDGTVMFGGGAVRRTAKKILVQKLTEWRKKQTKKKCIGEKQQNSGENLQSDTVDYSKNDTTDGALVCGFNPGDNDRLPSGFLPHQCPDSQNVQGDMNSVLVEDDEVISIQSNEKRQFSQLDDEENSSNDWEMSHAVQSSLNESICDQKNKEFDFKVRDFGNNQDIQQFDDNIASLPTKMRSEWIDSQFKAHRIQSRQECISAAANMEEYSSIQLRNFLKGSRLNKRLNEIGLSAAKGSADCDVQNGDSSHSIARDSTKTCAGSKRSRLQRLNRDGYCESNSDDASKNEDDLVFESFCTVQDGKSPDKSIVPPLSRVDQKEYDKSVDSGIVRDDSNILVTSSLTSNLYFKNINSYIENETNEISLAETHEEGSGGFLRNDTDNETKIEQNFSVNTTCNISTIPNRGIINSSTLDEFDHNQPYKLSSFTSADMEWAAWSRKHTDESTLFKHSTTASVGVTLLNSSQQVKATSDCSSDDEDDTTFLTLGNNCRQNRKTLSNNGIEVKNELTMSRLFTSDSAAERCLAIEANEAVNRDSDDDIAWEDGISDQTILIDGDEVHHERVPYMKKDHNDMNNPNVRYANNDSNGVYEAEPCSFNSHMPSQTRGASSSFDQICHPINISSGNSSFKIDLHDTEKSGEPGENEFDDAVFHKAGSCSSIRDTQTKLNLPEIESNLIEHDVLHLDGQINEFDEIHPNDPTIVALQHAQETAAKLTSWAGRAVQRAFAAHAGHNVYPEKTDAINSVVDLGDNENHTVIVEAHVENSPHTRINKNQDLGLLNTSLEALDEAHQKILEEERVMERDMSTVTDEMKDDIIKLLELCGIPWVESPSEAEAQCAALEELGLVDGIVTEDSDVFVFGGNKVYKNFFNEQQYVEAYYSKDAKIELGLGKNQLVALAMMLGSDYTDGIRGVGIVNGMEILQAFNVNDIMKGLKSFRRWLDGFGDPIESNDVDGNDSSHCSKEMIFHKKHKSARSRWIAPANFPSEAIMNAYLKPAVDKSETRFSWCKPDLEKLQTFCAENIGWDQEETTRILRPVLEVLQNKSRQTRIESYFMKYDDGITFAKVKSKRLKIVLGDLQGEK